MAQSCVPELRWQHTFTSTLLAPSCFQSPAYIFIDQPEKYGMFGIRCRRISATQSKEVYRNGTITLSWTPHSFLTLISLVHGAPDARFSPQHCKCASSTCKEHHQNWTNLFGIALMITTPPRKYLCFATRASIHSCTSLGKDLGTFVVPALWTTYALQTHGQ